MTVQLSNNKNCIKTFTKFQNKIFKMARNKEEEDYWNTSENRGFDFDGDKVFRFKKSYKILKSKTIFNFCFR